MRAPVLALAILGAGAGQARGGGGGEVVAPRAVGRAGTSTVSDDGAAAVLTSPAALARRDTSRAQLGIAIVDDGLDHRPARDGAPDVRAQSEPYLTPTIAVITGVGPVVIGAGIGVDRAGRRFAVPDPELSRDSVSQFFAYRYAGFSTRFERRTAALSAAARIADWLAVGVGASLASVRIEERRRLWAGFTSRLIDVGDPGYDVDVSVAGDDRAVPGAVFGVFVAPTSLPLELAASIAWTNQIHVSGGTTAFTQDPANLALASDGVPVARLDLPADTTVRAGARYLGDRWTLEAGVDAWIPRDDTVPVWRVDHLRVVDVLTDRSEPLVMASRFAPRRRIAFRAALDVEVVAGFLWLTAGYAHHSAGSPDDRLAPTTADLGGHTGALGVEVASGGFVASLGWSRTFAAARTVEATGFGLDDPFDPVVTTAGLGRYDASRDMVGLAIELATE